MFWFFGLVAFCMYMYMWYIDIVHMCVYMLSHIGTHPEAEVESGCLLGDIPGSLPTLGNEEVSYLTPELTDLTGLFSVAVGISSVCLFTSGIICEPTQPGNQMGGGDLNSSPHTYMASTLSSSPSLQVMSILRIMVHPDGNVIWLWCQNQRFRSYHHHGDDI